MRVLLQTPTQLVVHDGPLKTALIGGLFAAVGGAAITAWIVDPTGWSGNGGPWVIYLVGGLFCIIGLMLMVMSADRRYEFDRSNQTARMVVQRLAHRSVRQFSLDTLKDIALERSGGGSRDSSDFYRVVFLTRTGERIPWTPYSTGDNGSITSCASAVRSFCGWAAPTPGLTPPDRASATSPAASGNTFANNWGCLAAFLAIFVAVGIGIFGTEVYRVTTWRPVSARILSTDIKSVRGDDGTTYAPLVQYQYTFDGFKYSANGVLPVQMSSSRKWADKLRGRFRVGDEVTAYVNPRKPSSAYLIREISLLPLIFVAFPILFGAIFFWVERVQRRQADVLRTGNVPIVYRNAVLTGTR